MPNNGLAVRDDLTGKSPGTDGTRWARLFKSRRSGETLMRRELTLRQFFLKESTNVCLYRLLQPPEKQQQLLQFRFQVQGSVPKTEGSEERFVARDSGAIASVSSGSA